MFFLIHTKIKKKTNTEYPLPLYLTLKTFLFHHQKATAVIIEWLDRLDLEKKGVIDKV